MNLGINNSSNCHGIKSNQISFQKKSPIAFSTLEDAVKSLLSETSIKNSLMIRSQDNFIHIVNPRLSGAPKGTLQLNPKLKKVFLGKSSEDVLDNIKRGQNSGQKAFEVKNLGSDTIAISKKLGNIKVKENGKNRPVFGTIIYYPNTTSDQFIIGEKIPTKKNYETGFIQILRRIFDSKGKFIPPYF